MSLPESWRTHGNNHVFRIERELLIGYQGELEDALAVSGDSETLNTSFVERMNLTVRQGVSYLRRRSTCHARCYERLEDQLELFRCYYNFVRPHLGLKCGREVGTPAMQAGLVATKLTFREIFAAGARQIVFVFIPVDFRERRDIIYEQRWVA